MKLLAVRTMASDHSRTVRAHVHANAATVARPDGGFRSAHGPTSGEPHAGFVAVMWS
jgi:hypothetical protein